MTSLEAATKNYDTNIKSIPWNSSIAKNFLDSNTSINRTINNNLPIYSNLVEQQARNVTGAAAQRTKARSTVDMAINQLKDIPNTIDARISQIDIGGIQNKIKVVEESIAEERKKQGKATELLEIRKEQSASLEKKYSANYHSSWLGLWRPLKDSTHVGLNVASAMFGLLGLLTVGYLGYIFYSTRATGGAVETLRNSSNNLIAGLVGGFRKVKRAIN